MPRAPNPLQVTRKRSHAGGDDGDAPDQPPKRLKEMEQEISQLERVSSAALPSLEF
jgi:hypothetical protein